MTNIKRGLSQVARDINRIDEASKSQSKKNKSQSAQKVTEDSSTKAKELHESRPKKLSPQKRKKPPRSANSSIITIKKKDIEQHKNKTSSSTSKPKAKREQSEKETKKKKASKDTILNPNRSNSTIRNKRQDNSKISKHSPRGKSEESSIVTPKAYRERLSKDKLENYLSYITKRLSKERHPSPAVKGRHEQCFKSQDVFGTITYKTKTFVPSPKDENAESAKNMQKKQVLNSPESPSTDKPDLNYSRRSTSLSPSGKKITSAKGKNTNKKVAYKQSAVKQVPTKASTSKPTKAAAVSNEGKVLEQESVNVRAKELEKIENVDKAAKDELEAIEKHQKVEKKEKPKTPPKTSWNYEEKKERKSPNASAKIEADDVINTRKVKQREPKYTEPVVMTSRDSGTSKVLQEKLSSRYKKLKYQTGEELLKFYRDRVEKAIKDRKTFTVCGNFWSVRKALLARGWVEKIHYSYNQVDREQVKRLLATSLHELIDGVADKATGSLYKRAIMSKMLGRHQVDLFWDFGCDPYKTNPDNVKLTLINNIRRGLCSYSTKEGLCEIMKRSHWYHFPGVANIMHPRSYTLTDNGDPEEFIKDFRVTATMSMLKWIVALAESNQGKLLSEGGKIPIKNFHFALQECEKFLQRLRHEDIDMSIIQSPEYEWNNFLENYYRCVHIGNHFKSTDLESEQTVLHKSKIMLNKLKKFWPSLDMDGYMNIWILKPTAGSRGIGIHICRTLSYVLRVVSERKTIKYVIQKYIERPLLIYSTKFDIRQWFLISCTHPLTIWIYNMCYLRFSSQTYNLRKLHESIHLTNNSVQCKYKNMNRDPTLPEFNMWDSKRFKTYLETIGHARAYETTIYPGMKQCITAAVLIQQEYINTRKNCFELYGADFMLTEDFQPWLIEINSRPALYASTPITGKMCPQVLEDVIKVIVDHAHNPKADTGHFELMYKEELHHLPPVDAAALAVRGLPLSREYFLSPTTSTMGGAAGNRLVAKISSVDFLNINNAQHYMMYVSNEMKKTLKSLLEIISKERNRRKKIVRKSAMTTTRVPCSSATANTDVQGSSGMHLPASDCLPYCFDMATINENLKTIKEIFVPKHLSNNKLESVEKTLCTDGLHAVKSSNSSFLHSVVSTETDGDCSVENKNISAATSSGSQHKITFNIPKEYDEAIRKHSEYLQQAIGPLSKKRAPNSGFIAELFNYLTFWRMFANNKRISSTPTSSTNSRTQVQNVSK